MPLILAFDTETTGMVVWDRQATQGNVQPYILELACILLDAESGEHVDKFSHLITPLNRYDSYRPDPAAGIVHGITFDEAMAEGLAPEVVIRRFLDFKHRADGGGMAYSKAFDLKMLRIEMHRIGWDAEAELLRPEMWPCADPMPLARSVAKAQGQIWKSEKGRPKAPKLSEAMAYFFPDEDWQDAHRALPDCEAMCRVYMRAMEIERGAS